MRLAIAIVSILGSSVVGCSKDHGGAEEARREAEEQAKKEAANHEVAAVVKAPVAEGVHLPCDGVLDATKLTEALGETLPVTFKDGWPANKENALACSIVRGGTPPTIPEQEAIRKKEPRLGVLPGDEICYVQAICSRLETPDHFRAQCIPKGLKVEEGFVGASACVEIVGVGKDDIEVFHILDPDTKCVVKVGAGPSQTNNELTRTCAKTALALITPDALKVTPVPEGSAAPAPAAPAAPAP